MARHHVLVYPSYFVGSALSLLEALASGLALIQTPEAGNGVTAETGILLERPDTDLALAAMRAMIDDRDRLDHFRASAPAEALNYTFARYRENISTLLDQELLN
jgi:glycosyltransferase involved in cell wall biosynthesis